MFCISFGAENYKLDLANLSRSNKHINDINIPDTMRLFGIMVQFSHETIDNPKTSGDGHFLKSNYEEYINFYESDITRCEGFLVDRPPHNSNYFNKQLEAVGNYYNNVSDNNIAFSNDIISNSQNLEEGYYTVSKEMEYYAKSDRRLAELFVEAILLAKSDIEEFLKEKFFSSDEITFVVFHAGLSQDFSYPSLDPTIYDIKSAFIDEEMLDGISPVSIQYNNNLFDVMDGILLPETQNIIYYDVVEDIFGNPDYGTYNLCDIQMGLTGIFAFLLGYKFGFPEMFNSKTGDPGIGYFGLMDHGSNNGRGVIPAPPNPWIRSISDVYWSNIEQIIPYQNSENIYSLSSLDLNNQLYKIPISEREYFIIENRNNWIEDEVDIDSLRRKYKLFNSNSNDSLIGNWFDAVTNEKERFIKDSLIQIDPETKVITGFDHYDYGLPGSGILIWHINEPDQVSFEDGLNVDVFNRHIHLEEADGAQDIGKQSYAFFSSDDPTIGTKWDYWYLGNEAYEFSNIKLEDKVIFNDSTAPNANTTQGSKSFISIEILDQISQVMDFKLKFNDNIDIINLTDEPVIYLGNAVRENIGYIYYAKGDSIYMHSNLDGEIVFDIYNPNEDKYILTCCNNSELDILYSTTDNMSWIDTSLNLNILSDEYLRPSGYIYDYSQDTTVLFVQSDSSLAFGDMDRDGLDEVIYIENGYMYVRNGNGTLVNGFPVKGNFRGVPLIANILDHQQLNGNGNLPEILCREGANIVILSSKGKRIQNLSSFSMSQPLAMVPFWSGDSTIALIDGARLFIFELDLDNTFWINPRSHPSGLPISTGLHQDLKKNVARNKAYNYPNPVIENNTTFRFFIDNILTTEIKIKIFNAAGYLIKDDLVNNDLTYNEYNEINWNNISLDSGLYLAEVKPNIGKSELVRVLVIE